ncbi:unnamed protein product [Caenorhabditis brenneri]
MTILIQRRRFSALLDQFRNWTSSITDKQYRSLSTGDLVSPTSKPSQFEPDFIEMEFGSTPTTSSLPAHFDDCDLVPMEFTKNGVKLIPQGSKKAQKVQKRCASSEELCNGNIDDFHKRQSWFFMNVDVKSSERILMSDGLKEGSFLVSFFRGKYMLSVWKNGKMEHLVIRHYLKKNGKLAFQLDIDRSFKNLVDLTDYYTKNKSYVLTKKLTHGVSRPRKSLPTLQDNRSQA